MGRRFFTREELDALEDVLPHLIMRLPEDQRVVLYGIFYKGQSLGDLAIELDCQRSTVMRRRDRGIEALREAYLNG